MKSEVRAVFILSILAVLLSPDLLGAQFSSQRNAKAKELYERALEYEKSDQFREAIEVSLELVKNHPARTYIPNTLLLLGLCYENLYDFSKALRYYRKLLHGNI
jgi:tetratricopeptide (TPR) repeat protein